MEGKWKLNDQRTEEIRLEGYTDAHIFNEGRMETYNKK